MSSLNTGSIAECYNTICLQSGKSSRDLICTGIHGQRNNVFHLLFLFLTTFDKNRHFLASRFVCVCVCVCVRVCVFKSCINKNNKIKIISEYR